MPEDQELNHLRAQVGQLRSQLLVSEKMAALGALTAGVAHELNNPIGYVKNNTVMLGEYLQVLVPALREVLAWTQGTEAAEALAQRLVSVTGGEDLAPMLDDIEPLIEDTRTGAMRVEEIVGGLRRFARTDAPEGERFDLNQCVSDTLKVAQNELKYKATVIEDLDLIPALFGKPGQVNQVILNLLVNAAHAITGFGEIRIQTRLVGDEAQLCVTDNGCGIGSDDLAQLFTPFFTTKPAGRGTGLGLAISRDIVSAHGGRIEVTSEVGAGSEFRVLLPVPADTVG